MTTFVCYPPQHSYALAFRIALTLVDTRCTILPRIWSLVRCNSRYLINPIYFTFSALFCCIFALRHLVKTRLSHTLLRKTFLTRTMLAIAPLKS